MKRLTLRSLIFTRTAITALSLATALPLTAKENEPRTIKTLEELKALENSIHNMTETCREATVSLQGRVKGKTGAGSGVIVSEDGLILTAAHVLDAMGEKVTVRLSDGRSVTAKPLGADFDRDAGMLKIIDKGSYPHVRLGDSDALTRNQWCIAMGHPGGYDEDRQPPLRLGRILVNGDFVLSDCTVVGGDSGGPLFDTKGRLIGIHSSIGFTLSQNRHVPISVYLDNWQKLESGEQYGKRFAQNTTTPETQKAKAVDLGEVDDEGKDDLDRFLDKAMNGETGKMELRLTPEDIERFGSLDTIMARVKERNAAEAGDSDASAETDEATTDEEQSSGKSASASSGLELLQMMQNAKENGGQLEMTPEMLEKVGGISGLMKQLNDLGVVGQGEKMSGMAVPEEMKGPDHFFQSIMKTVTPVAEKASSQVASVMADGKQLTMATVVSDDGLLLAPSTQLSDQSLKVNLGDKQYKAEVITRFTKHDLALLKIEAEDLTPVKWVSKDIAKAGTILTSPAPNGKPMGIGLVSVEERSMLAKGFLGVRTEGSKKGAQVKMVTPDSPAERAGIEVDDIIYEIAGTKIGKNNIGKVVRKFEAGDSPEVKLRRDGESLTKTVELASRETSIQPKRFQIMNQMSGPLSPRKSGYPQAIQHDIPLSPSQCGSPLLNLDGECVGINISRAGRVKTLAIPATTILDLLESYRTTVESS